MSRSVSLVRTEAPAAETGAGIRVPLWDRLRGMAILMVLFLFHDLPGAVDRWQFPDGALLSRGCVPDGLAGVALFFILSS
jgi:peptidoglycan/LPS O-acetylase OafA/YrhL